LPRIACPAAFVCVLVSVPVAAQTPAAIFPTARMAFFDGQRVAIESETGQAAFAELEAFQTEASAELERRNQALLGQRQQFQTQISVLSGSARLDMEHRLERETLDLQRLVEDSQKQFLELQQRLDGIFLAQLQPAVTAVAGDTSVHFIFDRVSSPIAWADPAYDLTDRIIERLDAN